MTKLREVIGAAVMEVEGSPEACDFAQSLFHRSIITIELREIDAELTAQQDRRRVLRRRRNELMTALANIGDETAP